MCWDVVVSKRLGALEERGGFPVTGFSPPRTVSDCSGIPGWSFEDSPGYPTPLPVSSAVPTAGNV
eukprot:12937196-Prorocentrum_lima.AAC.1